MADRVPEKDVTNASPAQAPSGDQLDLFRSREYILKLIKGLPGDRLEVEPEDLMNGAEVRVFLPCSIRRMYQLINAGLLHQVRRERYQAYYLRSEVEALKRDLDGPGDGQDGPPSGGGPKGPGGSRYRKREGESGTLTVIETLPLTWGDDDTPPARKVA